jgi:hypothetical protein
MMVPQSTQNATVGWGRVRGERRLKASGDIRPTTCARCRFIVVLLGVRAASTLFMGVPYTRARTSCNPLIDT